MGWRNMPLGMKFIFIWAIIITFRSIYELFNSLDVRFFFGYFFEFPLSLVMGLFILLISLIILVGIYRGSWHKLTLTLLGIVFLNALISSIVILTTPLSELASKLGRSLPKASVEIIQSASYTAKVLTALPMVIGLIILLTIWIYVFKKKDYFTHEML